MSYRTDKICQDYEKCLTLDNPLCYDVRCNVYQDGNKNCCQALLKRLEELKNKNKL